MHREAIDVVTGLGLRDILTALANDKYHFDLGAHDADIGDFNVVISAAQAGVIFAEVQGMSGPLRLDAALKLELVVDRHGENFLGIGHRGAEVDVLTVV